MAQDVPVAEAQNGTEWHKIDCDVAQIGGVFGENLNETREIRAICSLPYLQTQIGKMNPHAQKQSHDFHSNIIITSSEIHTLFFHGSFLDRR